MVWLLPYCFAAAVGRFAGGTCLRTLSVSMIDSSSGSASSWPTSDLPSCVSKPFLNAAIACFSCSAVSSDSCLVCAIS